MSNLPTSGSGEGIQKAISVGLIGATIWGGIKLFNSFAPDLIWFLENVWRIVIFGTPLLFLTLYVISNPFMIWNIYKGLSAKLTAFIIKMDPLSVMDRYVEFLQEKKQNLDNTVVILRGKQTKINRALADLEKQVEQNKRLGITALNQNDEATASLYGVKMKSLQDSIQVLQPIALQIDASVAFLSSLAANWGRSIEQLVFQIDIKRQEFETVRDTMGGLKNAEEYINGGTEAGKRYGESLKALEESVTQKMGYIQEFDRKSAPILKKIEMEKTAASVEGLEQLQAIMRNDQLKLTIPTTKTETIKIQSNNKFDL
jgi:hypothetical protein